MNQTMTTKESSNKLTIYQMCVTALMAAVMCILGPLSIPIGPVPITLTNFVIFLSIYLLGTRNATISCALYLFIGTIGLPVFSGYAGGLAKLVGPTGGFLIGFIPMTIIAGLIMTFCKWKRIPSILGMIAGTLALYILGTLWFVIIMKVTVSYALTVCVIPFLLGDLIKMILASIIGELIRNRLIRMGLITKA